MREDFQQAVEAIERVRCEATLGDDWATLAQIFSNELGFVHSSGYVHDKVGYLDFLRTRVKTLRISRPAPPTCKIIGGSVLVFGPIDQQMERRADAALVNVSGWTTQLWTRNDNAWKLIHQQSTRRSA
ncbi:nuclear transport factor 2 family protein [Paraburkholderia terrae]|uniref:nuclear transport factor 2 family protein n=1 Tax=Paraburkholderia terrae TaxID=311230 RepID=UPI00296AAEA3|nr:nuclear transport factor 2 family protein [Paraburkholderia terrae]MDW3661863.1 nuclear transport factor 2 family protein [Paraburkholderia terrae]